jgi:hypothetical protein
VGASAGKLKGLGHPAWQGGWVHRPCVSLTVCFSGLPTVVKLVDRDTLLKEREEKKRVSKIKTTELDFVENENSIGLLM